MIEKKHLFLFINDFPYNSGEPFFEKELPFLYERFDRIVIFSVVGKKKQKPTRIIGNKVEVIPLGCNHSRIKYSIKGLFASNTLFDSKVLRGKKFLTALYLKGRNYSIYKKAIKYIKNNFDKDANHFIYSYWLTLGIASVLTKQHLESLGVRNVRCISRCHRYDIYNELHPFSFIPYQEETIEQLDSVYSCSEHGHNYLVSRYPSLSSKIKVARLFSEDHGLAPFINEDKKVLLTVSGFRKVKRLDLFVKAFALAVQQNNDAIWVAIGDGSELENVKNIVKKEKIEKQVLFLGNISNDDVYNFYESNSVYFFCNVSSSEGIPVSIMEATSFGIPVLATDVGGTSEIVGDKNGVLIDKDVTEFQLSNHIQYCLNLEKERYLQMRQESRKNWESNYNLITNLDKWYNEIIND